MKGIRYQTLENPTGVGTVSKNGKQIAQVFYYLRVERKMLQCGDGEIPGRVVVSGQVTVLDGERDLLDGSLLTLQMEDSRQWQFCARKGDRVAATYQVSNSSVGVRNTAQPVAQPS